VRQFAAFVAPLLKTNHLSSSSKKSGPIPPISSGNAGLDDLIPLR
jgi:hypothetical protein